MYYTFRHLQYIRLTDRHVFECCKWGNEKEPLDVYTIVVGKRFGSCNCYAKGPCKHIEAARIIVQTGTIRDMPEYIWNYGSGDWERISDMVLA